MVRDSWMWSILTISWRDVLTTDKINPKISDPNWIIRKEKFKNIKYENFRISDDIVMIQMKKYNRMHQKYIIDIKCEKIAYTEYQNNMM